MQSQTVKTLSSLAFWAGCASVAISAGIYLTDLARGGTSNKRREGGIFVGLWPPTFFMISDMLDRIAEQDKQYMGVPIEERGRATPITERARDLVRR